MLLCPAQERFDYLNFQRLYVTEPMLSTIGESGMSFVCILGVQYIFGVILAVGTKKF